MGKNRTGERRKARDERRAERRRYVAAENARKTAEHHGTDPRDLAYRLKHPGEPLAFHLYFRRNYLGSLVFSGHFVDFHPEEAGKGQEEFESAISERVRQLKVAVEKAGREPPN